MKTKILRMASNEELTPEKLHSFIIENQQKSQKNYEPLQLAYENHYKIFDAEKKDDWKPDNRIAVNFAKYITDTFNGFFIGIPIKYQFDGENTEQLKEFVEFLDSYNNQDDQNAELSKIMDMFGRGYEMYYVDEAAKIGITYLSPMEAFIIYDDSILTRPRFFVRYYLQADEKLHGSISDDKFVWHFTVDDSLKYDKDFEEKKPHGFKGVPAVEYVENAERIGLYEGAMSMIDAYNKALSEKANDVDAFADAYLKIIGPKVENSAVTQMRKNRVIAYETDNPEGTVIDFLERPSADNTQEHLIDRLEKQIFATTMVANISDENFATQSGIALKYKMLCMNNLRVTKVRKFTAGLQKRFKLIFSNPLSGMKEADWMKIKPIFTPNFPANISDEAETAAKLSGIVSNETRLSLLSCVENIEKEMEKINAENSNNYQTKFPVSRTTGENE